MSVVSPSNEIRGLTAEIQYAQHLTAPVDRPMTRHEDLVSYLSAHRTSVRSTLWPWSSSADWLMDTRVQMPWTPFESSEAPRGEARTFPADLATSAALVSCKFVPVTLASVGLIDSAIAW